MADLTEQPLNVTALPALGDNYIWLIDNGTYAAVIDPGDAAVVITELQKRALSLSAILLTHRHDDHISGVPRLVTEYDSPVYGPKNDDIPFVNHPLQEGDPLIINALNLSLAVLDVPVTHADTSPIMTACGNGCFAVICCLAQAAAEYWKAHRK